jgi:hypothetical protein
MNNLSVTLFAQGELSKAFILGEKALEGRRRVLGEEHPETLNIMSNLTATLNAQGDFATARLLGGKALEGRMGIFGKKHPDTTISAWNLLQTFMPDDASTVDILEKHLLWLLNCDPAVLDANQRQIRELLPQFLNRATM